MAESPANIAIPVGVAFQWNGWWNGHSSGTRTGMAQDWNATGIRWHIPPEEDLSLPRVILVESTWIRGLHGCSMDSMEFFLAVDTPKFSFSVHGLSTDNPHITMIFIIFMESMDGTELVY